MKKCAQIREKSGETKIVATPYRLEEGETVVRKISCEGEIQSSPVITTPEAGTIPLGSLIEKTINLLPESMRPAHCTKCEKRKRALNYIKEHGIVETMRQLKEIGL